MSRTRKRRMMNQINVVPYIDVTLVLLVIFMVTAPALMKEIIDIKLPKTASSDGSALLTLGVAINREGNILLNGNLQDDSTLREATKRAVLENPNTKAIISADAEVVYKHVIRVIDILKSSGLNQFAVQIEKPDSEL